MTEPNIWLIYKYAQGWAGTLPVETSGVGLATASAMEETARAAWVRRVNFMLIEVE
jgi:hypothetical protein